MNNIPTPSLYEGVNSDMDICTVCGRGWSSHITKARAEYLNTYPDEVLSDDDYVAPTIKHCVELMRAEDSEQCGELEEENDYYVLKAKELGKVAEELNLRFGIMSDMPKEVAKLINQLRDLTKEISSHQKNRDAVDDLVKEANQKIEMPGPISITYSLKPANNYMPIWYGPTINTNTTNSTSSNNDDFVYYAKKIAEITEKHKRNGEYLA